MSIIGESSVVCKSRSQVSTALDDEVVALSLENSRYFKMAGVGRLIWERLAEPVRVGEIVDQLAGEFEVGREECLADTVRFLNASREAGLIEVCNVCCD